MGAITILSRRWKHSRLSAPRPRRIQECGRVPRAYPPWVGTWAGCIATHVPGAGDRPFGWMRSEASWPACAPTLDWPGATWERLLPGKGVRGGMTKKAWSHSESLHRPPSAGHPAVIRLPTRKGKPCPTSSYLERREPVLGSEVGGAKTRRSPPFLQKPI